MARETSTNDEQTQVTATAERAATQWTARSPRREPFTGHQALVVIGVERLGVITAAMGPDSTEELLATLTARLRATIGPGGSIARTGDDEFAIVSDDLRDREQAVSLAGRLIEAVTPLIVVDRLAVFLTAHAGVAYGASAIVTSRLLSNASAALAQARLRAGEAVAVYDLPQ